MYSVPTTRCENTPTVGLFSAAVLAIVARAIARVAQRYCGIRATEQYFSQQFSPCKSTCL